MYLYEWVYRTGGVLVIVLSSSTVDRWFESGSGQSKDYNIGICFFSAEYIALKRERAKTGWLRIGIMCPSGATWLSADCCFSELALYKNIKIQLTVLV
jgi:hypothetical protein